jgi:hypothetical protein
MFNNTNWDVLNSTGISLATKLYNYMKKILLLILVAGLVSFADAQIQFGVKGGVNLANLNLSNSGLAGYYKSITKFNAGVVASIPLSKMFYLQPEVIFSEQGSVVPETTNVKFEVNTQYINVPVLFKYLHKSGLFAETGPQVGFLTAADVSYATKYSIKNSSEPVDFSWAFGAGYKLPCMNLGVDARYNLGLTTMDKSSSSGTVKNSVFQIDLFYQFRSL